MNARILVLSFTMLSLPFIVTGQSPHPILRSFDAIKQPNGVLLKWVIKGGQQCQGTWVYRADESELFEVINHVEGICGDFTEDETYTYFDNSPRSNAYNRYRLEMGMQGFTDTITLFFEDFGSDNYLLLSENGQFKILFSNDLSREATLQLFDLSGKVLREEKTLQNDIEVDPAGLRAGVYLFRISGVSESDITGKLYFSGE